MSKKELEELEKIYLLKLENLYKEYIKQDIDYDGEIDKYCLDNENLHIESDKILLDILLKLKFTKIVNLYENIKDYFWYS